MEDSGEPATAGAVQEKKSKKEKKRKAEEETAPVEKAAELDMEASEKKRRKEEKRAAKRKVAAEAEAGAEAGSAVASSSTNVEKVAESAADKKKDKKEKKDKKRKRAEEVAVADADADSSTRYSPSVPVAAVQPEVEGSSSDPVAPSEEVSSTPKPPKRPKRSKLEKQQAAEAAAAEAAAELARRKAAGEDVEESSAVPVGVADAEPLEGAYGDESLTESAKKCEFGTARQLTVPVADGTNGQGRTDAQRWRIASSTSRRMRLRPRRARRRRGSSRRRSRTGWSSISGMTRRWVPSQRFSERPSDFPPHLHSQSERLTSRCRMHMSMW